MLVSALSVASGLSYIRLDCFRLDSGAWANQPIVRELKCGEEGAEAVHADPFVQSSDQYR
jgi:hypothetical protein